MPSKHESSARVDYVPALCTHFKLLAEQLCRVSIDVARFFVLSVSWNPETDYFDLRTGKISR